MPKLNKDSGDVVAFVDFLYGKEQDSNESIAAIASHFRSHVRLRPARGSPAPFPSIEVMRTNIRHHGPDATDEQFNVALAAYVAS